jgi:hypothetical protein
MAKVHANGERLQANGKRLEAKLEAIQQMTEANQERLEATTDTTIDAIEERMEAAIAYFLSEFGQIMYNYVERKASRCRLL